MGNAFLNRGPLHKGRASIFFRCCGRRLLTQALHMERPFFFPSDQQAITANSSLAAKFKAVREQHGLTLAEVAERMGIDAPPSPALKPASC